MPKTEDNMKRLVYLSLMLIGLLSCGESKYKDAAVAEENQFEILATSDNQWTGITVDKHDRIYVNFPAWSENIPMSVAEIVDGKPVAFPNRQWNNTENKESFKAVQSVVVDKKNRMWIIDTNNPMFQGVGEKGPVLYLFDIENRTLTKKYTFPKSEWGKNSYYNDIRVDTENEKVYMTDSGESGIIVMDIKSGEAKRYLHDHPSTLAETNYLVCNNYKWDAHVHSDGIALSPDNKYLYYVALSGHTLYRIPTKILNEGNPTAINIAVEKVRVIPATDGMMFDDKGNLWLGGLEDNGVNVLTPNLTLKQASQSPEFRWADSFAKGSTGQIYFATSQIYLPEAERGKYSVIRLDEHILDQAETQNKILIALTSHGTLGENDGDPTGYYLSEVSHAYYAFKEAGFDIDFVSPLGGKSPVTGLEDKDDLNEKFLADAEAQEAVENSYAAGSVNPHDYTAIYYAGGHGVMWDFPENKELANIAMQIYERGGIVSAVCHGPTGLLNIKLTNGHDLIEGKNIATFTNAEEKAINLDEIMPFALQTELEHHGAIVHIADLFQEKVMEDQRLVTGQNPASAKGVAKSVIRMLGK